MRLRSPAFKDGGRIPERYTCDGEDISPPLRIEDVPVDTASLALIVDDPDAPGGTFVHWLIWNLPPSVDELPEGLPREGTITGFGATEQGRNDFGEIGWRGPCPPEDSDHAYHFRLYALDATITLGPGVDRKRLEAAMDGLVTEETELIGTYGR